MLIDKEYIDGRFAEEMEEDGVECIAITRRNMIKTEEEAVYYRVLKKVRRLIKT